LVFIFFLSFTLFLLLCSFFLHFPAADWSVLVEPNLKQQRKSKSSAKPCALRPCTDRKKDRKRKKEKRKKECTQQLQGKKTDRERAFQAAPNIY